MMPWGFGLSCNCSWEICGCVQIWSLNELIDYLTQRERDDEIQWGGKKEDKRSRARCRSVAPSWNWSGISVISIQPFWVSHACRKSGLSFMRSSLCEAAFVLLSIFGCLNTKTLILTKSVWGAFISRLVFKILRFFPLTLLYGNQSSLNSLHLFQYDVHLCDGASWSGLDFKELGLLFS